MKDSQKHVRLALWKRLILIAGMLLPAGSLALLAPSQAAYADGSWWPQSVFICRAGHGGNGGIANNGSSGAGGSPGGDCTNGPHGGNGAPGGNGGPGQTASPGGPGGNVVL